MKTTLKDRKEYEVNKFGKSVGHYCKEHIEEVKALKTKEDFINFFSSIPDSSLSTESREYRDSLIVKFGNSTAKVCTELTWNMLLAGDNERVIR